MTYSDSGPLPIFTRENSFSDSKTGKVDWENIQVQVSDELRPDRTLIMGQCFHWRQLSKREDSTSLFVGVVNGTSLAVTYDGHLTHYTQLNDNSNVKQTSDSTISNQRMLSQYFQLSYSLSELYADWSRGCERMATVAGCLRGVRVVKQDPWECLVSFICSSNNNIKRIALMLDRLRFMFGQYLCSVQPIPALPPSNIGTSESIAQNGCVNTQWLVRYDDHLKVVSSAGSSSAGARSIEEVLAFVRSPSQPKRPTSSATSPVPNLQTRSDGSVLSPLKQSRLSDFIDSDVVESKSHPQLSDTAPDDASEERGEGGDEYIADDTTLDTETPAVLHLFAFPSIESIAAAEESALRELGMGYRAKFIVGTARKIQQLGGIAWLQSLECLGRLDMLKNDLQKVTSSDSSDRRHAMLDELAVVQIQYNAAISNLAPENIYPGTPGDGKSRLWVQAQLTLLPGVGRKVADCVALFSLNQPAAIPVDTHVWDIAVRNYDPSLANHKSLTPTVYEKVGDIFRDKFGPYAGWAHSVLFASELPEFRALLPEAMQQEMKDFAKQQSVLKAAKKEEAKAASSAKKAKSDNKK